LFTIFHRIEEFLPDCDTKKVLTPGEEGILMVYHGCVVLEFLLKVFKLVLRVVSTDRVEDFCGRILNNVAPPD
jgi:hypothetical protein